MTAIWVQLLEGLLLTLPAYLPNSAAAFFGGGKPVDGGRNFSDGRRLLGDGKTWRGTLCGTGSGIVLGLILVGLAAGIASVQDQDATDYFGEFPFLLWVIFLLALGSLLGDMGASFLKRRLNVKRGAKAPGLDQYDFLIGAWLLTLIGAFGWYRDWFLEFDPLPWRMLAVIVVTPALHRGVNIIGYKMGKKDVPW